MFNNTFIQVKNLFEIEMNLYSEKFHNLSSIFLFVDVVQTLKLIVMKQNYLIEFKVDACKFYRLYDYC